MTGILDRIRNTTVADLDKVSVGIGPDCRKKM